MGVIESSTSLCLGNEHCLQLVEKLMGNETETASMALGIISVIVWVVAEIPQIITNYREKSTEGLSVAFLLTWIIGDLFNIFGCLLEPATLPTQLYIAVLYTFITLSLCTQSIYYGHIYPRLQYKRQLKVDTPTNAGQCWSRMEKPYDADQYNEFDDYNKRIGLSSPINVPALSQKNSVGRQLYYQSARYLSKSHTATAQSILPRSSGSTSNISNPIEDPLLGPSVLTQSAPNLMVKSTRCLVSALTFLGAINLLQSLDTRTHSMVSKPRRELVIYVGRKLFQVSGHQLPEVASVYTGIGTLLGWAMAFIYMGGRLPQICLNIRRGNFEGVNPLMFLFALVGNSTYVASILVTSLDWSRIRPNLPWLVESGGCALLDSFILMQFIYFRYRTSQGLEIKCKQQSVA
ncbi:probable vacuolar amino acid transporter YPQ1 isoform X2 [Lotus japonicus]|uniref:probable vacuolar amino acid transporter YPQ1 isoform X2 n=1 Tax=Lotus japonicus TaxID=34305 RepID=UPI0025835EB5|nr:probable vacuolar amino acid transporter YPQ1 isoform X2 [Lotus japonicus]